MAVVNMTGEQVEELLKSDDAKSRTVVVDFWAPWCGPCRAFGPILEKIADENQEHYFVKVNVDENQEFASKHSIMSIPTVWVQKNGEIVYSRPGLLQADQLKDLL